jgi:hypothetical protein
MAVFFDSDQILKTHEQLCNAAPPGAVGARRDDAAGGLEGQLEVGWVELEPRAVRR